LLICFSMMPVVLGRGSLKPQPSGESNVQSCTCSSNQFMHADSSISRRQFLQNAVFIGSALLSDFKTLAASSPEWDSQTPEWVDRPMRWAQLTLVENDPGKFDLKFWIDYFKRTRSD